MDGDSDKAKGTGDQVKGKVKEAAGDLTDDESMKNQGRTDEAKGKVQEGVGRVKDAADDLTS